MYIAIDINEHQLAIARKYWANQSPCSNRN